jgi:hypothetical protein
MTATIRSRPMPATVSAPRVVFGPWVVSVSRVVSGLVRAVRGRWALRRATLVSALCRLGSTLPRGDRGLCVGSTATPGPKAGERGSITVWLLGLAVLVLFVGGLSLDLWRAFSARQLLANAADAAAIAGATGIDTTRFRDTGQLVLDPSLATQRAGDSLAHQGGLPLTAPPGVDVTPDPPQVVVVLTGQVRLTLLRVLLPNQPPLTIRVSAASVPREIP